MGSLTPPWADELLARNSKVARKMMSSMSTESYFEPEEHKLHQPSRPNRFLSSFTNSVNNDNAQQKQGSASSTPTSLKSPLSHNTKSNGESEKVDDLRTTPANTRMASFQSPSSSLSSTTRSSAVTSFSLPITSSAATLKTRSQLQKQQQPLSKNTEKLSPIRNERDEMFVDENKDEVNKKSFEMTNGSIGVSGGGEDLSILEYGPGIVKKLRSRYQSLALRQYAARPTLRRSASLENVLDAVSAEELAATLESKLGSNGNQLEDERNGITNGSHQHRGRNRFQNGSMAATTIVQPDSRTSSPVAVLTTIGVSAQQEDDPQLPSIVEQNGKSSNFNNAVGGSTPRGRASGLDATAKRDRMRRARSVDALHRTKREEEILEKFKHVVLPKEEIVIIEVSKPLPQDGSGGGISSAVNVFNQMENGNQTSGSGDNKRLFPTRFLLTSTNNFRNSAASILDQQSANINVRNLMISPEHELPPADIVRETARIFEKNQENLNRRVGQALRLSKSQSQQSVSTGVGSPPLAVPQSPTSPTPPTTATNHSTSQQNKSVMAQSTTTSSTSSSPSMQPSQDKSSSSSFPTNPSSNKIVDVNNATAPVQANNAMANGPSSHGQKQIGIIKPTLNNSSSGGVINSSKISNGGSGVGSGSVLSENRVRSPILSPIGFLSNQKPLIQSSQKPPLSPKPIFTSSPKVTFPTTGSLNGIKGNKLPGQPLSKESPSTSPILIIDNNRDHRSLSPFNSESPIPRGIVADQVARVKSPVSNRPGETPPDSLEEDRRSESSSARSPSPVVNNDKISPISNGETTNNIGFNKRLQAVNNKPSEEEREIIVLKHTKPPLQNGHHANSTDHRQQISKDNIPPPPPRTTSPISVPTAAAATPAESNVNNSSNKQVSQLRVHQKQKSSQGSNGSLVFNFTSRKEVPDYIEDDGLRRSGGGSDGRMESGADGLPSLIDIVDNRLAMVMFEGGNVIINGKSSIQKKPKSQKLNISFNEEATTTHEYPSETSLLIAEEDPAENENSVKKPNVISGSSLGSYTPKVGSNSYQLGSYSPFESPTIIGQNKKSNSSGLTNQKGESENDFIEDYLKPNTESTTWSNEMSSDILF